MSRSFWRTAKTENHREGPRGPRWRSAGVGDVGPEEGVDGTMEVYYPSGVGGIGVSAGRNDS